MQVGPFSFGTSDLTQTALGFSRDDVESKFVPAYRYARDKRSSPPTLSRRSLGTIGRRGIGTEHLPAPVTERALSRPPTS